MLNFAALTRSDLEQVGAIFTLGIYVVGDLLGVFIGGRNDEKG